MIAAFQVLARVQDRVTLAGAWLGAAALGLIVSAYVLEVASRYFFSAPTDWATEAVNYLLCAMIFLLLPELTRRKAHIAITFLLEKLPAGVETVVEKCLAAIAMATCATAAVISLDANIVQYVEEIVTQAARPIPKWIVSAFITYGFAGAALYYMRELLRPAGTDAAGTPGVLEN